MFWKLFCTRRRCAGTGRRANVSPGARRSASRSTCQTFPSFTLFLDRVDLVWLDRVWKTQAILWGENWNFLIRWTMKSAAWWGTPSAPQRRRPRIWGTTRWHQNLMSKKQRFCWNWICLSNQVCGRWGVKLSSSGPARRTQSQSLSWRRSQNAKKLKRYNCKIFTATHCSKLNWNVMDWTFCFYY